MGQGEVTLVSQQTRSELTAYVGPTGGTSLEAEPCAAPSQVRRISVPGRVLYAKEWTLCLRARRAGRRGLPAAQETPWSPVTEARTRPPRGRWGGGLQALWRSPTAAWRGPGTLGRSRGGEGQGAPPVPGVRRAVETGACLQVLEKPRCAAEMWGYGVPRDLRAAPCPQESGREGPGVGRGVRARSAHPRGLPDPGGRMSRVMVEPEAAPRWPEGTHKSTAKGRWTARPSPAHRRVGAGRNPAFLGFH